MTACQAQTLLRSQSVLISEPVIGYKLRHRSRRLSNDPVDVRLRYRCLTIASAGPRCLHPLLSMKWRRRGSHLERSHTVAQSLQNSGAGLASSGVQKGRYVVSQQDIETFHKLGYVHLPGVLSEEELEVVIDPVYDAFLEGKISVRGKDLCDMSGAKGRTPDQFTVYNVMLPRTYYPAWQGNVFEQRCKDIADQLQGGDMVPDYDQILAKRPNSADAVFAWHQDMAYWPPFTAETATATCWLAVTDATKENGCMRFVPASHTEPELRPHSPVGKTREESHALKTELREDDVVVEVPIRRGDITVHNERVVHGSGPNLSDGYRKAYVLAFRKAACVAEERSHGFTHSHNDTFNWDVFHKHGQSS